MACNFSLPAIVVSVTLMTSTTYGANKYFYNNCIGANWDAPGVWYTSADHATLTTMPGDGDTAIILPCEKVGVNLDVHVDSFEVQGACDSGGHIMILTGKTLQIDLNSSVGPYDGVKLDGSTSKLQVNESLTLSGGGSLKGYATTAKIDIASGKTLTLTSTAHGVMQIGGSGSFVNNGAVKADDRGTLEIQGSLSSLSGSGKWKAITSAAAVLVFREGSSSLTGSFRLNQSASIAFDGVAITTSGSFSAVCGTVDVSKGGSFSYGSPPTTISADTSYTNPPSCS